MKESKKFAELMRTDESFQAKLKSAAETYSGEKTEEAVFNGVLLPVAKEYGISVSYEELHDYISKLAHTDEIMDKDELTQIVGGKGGGLGGGYCKYVGVGAGGAGGDGEGFGCIVLGFGTTYGCIGEGEQYYAGD